MDEQIACTLTSADLAAQAGRWQRLRARAQVNQHVTHDGIRLEFDSSPDIEAELRELVAVESECCAWANWTVTRRDDKLVLEVQSGADGAAALQGMFVDALDTMA